MYMDRIIKDAKGERNMSPLVLAYADDIAVVAKSWEDLQTEMDKRNDALNWYRMQMNVTKTEVMCVDRRQVEGRIEVEGQQLKQVEHFKYLGVEFCENNQLETEINSRIPKYNNTFNFLPTIKRKKHST
ncbi:uncharacterized protein LOC143037320 [Oratosquilla oratoria]|uniref:uncharacterized protein LOC143037320 n=1 Tax=Oratosquilla oratoria TaxID=337810 RepID=UPI003F75AC99